VLPEERLEAQELATALRRLPRAPIALGRDAWIADRAGCETRIEAAAVQRTLRERMAGRLARRLGAGSTDEVAARLLRHAVDDGSLLVLCAASAWRREGVARALHDLALEAGGRFLAIDASGSEDRQVLEPWLQGLGGAGSAMGTLLLDRADGATDSELEGWLTLVRGSAAVDGCVRVLLGCEDARHLPACARDARRWSIEDRSELRGTDQPVGCGLAEVEREHVLATLGACEGNKSLAAKRLGIHRSTLHAKLRGWGVGEGVAQRQGTASVAIFDGPSGATRKA
jgi:transcriptional regulator of acetoin/glycerol metabolism